MKIEEAMTRDVITVSPQTPIHQAAKVMVDHGISGLPVIDDEGRLVGVISDGDRIIRLRPRLKTPWWRSFFDHGERLAREYQQAVGTTVGEVMTRPRSRSVPSSASRLPPRSWMPGEFAGCPSSAMAKWSASSVVATSSRRWRRAPPRIIASRRGRAPDGPS